MNPLMRTNNTIPALIENFFGRDVNKFFSTNSSPVHTIPAVNVVEHQNGFRLDVAAPGLKKEDFRLNLNHASLTISAHQETQKEEPTKGERTGEKYTHREFSYSSFRRTFTLPTSVDVNTIQASYADGILKVEFLKREETNVKPPRQIEIGG